MKVWLPMTKAGSGIDVFTELLKRSLKAAGHQAELQKLNHYFQYFPSALRWIDPPTGTDAIITNSWNGFAFRRSKIPLIVIEHHCIFHNSYLPYRSIAQGVFHSSMVKRFELNSFRLADAVVSVSQYTADSLKEALRVDTTRVIPNGIDVDFFRPLETLPERTVSKPFRLLFVGNLSTRKGVDLLPPIMKKLGSGFELVYTGGLRSGHEIESLENSRPLGRLTQEQLRQQYQTADALVFPTRLEGFGYAAAEAMACGTPVVASRNSSLPEVVEHGITGILCQTNAVEEFATAISDLAREPARLQTMGMNARKVAVRKFRLDRMAADYIDLVTNLMENP